MIRVKELPPRPAEEEDQYDEYDDDDHDISYAAHCSLPKGDDDIQLPVFGRAKDAMPVRSASTHLQGLYEAQSRELSLLRLGYRAALEERERLADDYESLKQQYDERSEELDVVCYERQEARAQKREIEGAYAVLKQQYEEQTGQLDAMRNERRVALEPKVAERVAPASPLLQGLYEAQSRELNLLRCEHQVAIEEQRLLEDDYESLKQQHGERSKKLDAMRQERQEARTRWQEVANAYRMLMLQHKEQTKELKDVRRECHAVLDQQQNDYATLVEEHETQRKECSNLRNKCQSLENTLEQRESELRDAQRSLTSTDKFSGSEVVSALLRLNEEVQQSTTFMAEWAVENFALKPPVGETVEQPCPRTSEFLGIELVQLLGTRKHRDDSILVEMAFRAYLVCELHRIASPWSIEEEQAAYMDRVYQRIRDAEGHVHLKSDPEPGHKLAMTITIISGFSDILLTAGCTAPRTHIITELSSKFAEKIRQLVSLSEQVKKLIGVGVIWEEFEVRVVRPNTVFDAKVMEDSYDDGDNVQEMEEHKGTVLCATELGLVQRIRMGAGTGQNGKLYESIVMKPKVALASVIDIIDESVLC